MTDQERRTEAVLRIAQEDLCRRIVEFSPQISADVQVMAQVIRELVALEREKHGFDRLRGSIELEPNKGKTQAAQPDFEGWGRVAGRGYRAAAWPRPGNKIHIELLARKSKK